MENARTFNLRDSGERGSNNYYGYGFTYFTDGHSSCVIKHIGLHISVINYFNKRENISF